MKIFIHKISSNDRQKIMQWKSDFELSAQIMSNFRVVSESDAVEWIEANSNDQLQRLNGIYFQPDGDEPVLVGISRLSFIDPESRTAEYGIYIGDASYRNKGIGNETLKLTLQQAFSELNLNKVYLRVATDNQSAIHLYRKHGFVEEGLLKEHYFNLHTKAFQDVLCMAVFNPDA